MNLELIADRYAAACPGEDLFILAVAHGIDGVG